MKNKQVKKEIKFDLLENAFDFILSALKYIVESRTKSNLKYAVLHLCAGTELILKESLRREHWSLLFEDINKANIQDFKSGNFTSVSFIRCIERLKGICNISFSNKDERYLFNLREKRNRLEHFGIIDSAEALTSLTAQVLSILLDFINDKLYPDEFSETEAILFNNLRSKSGEFDKLVIARFNKIKPDLKQAKEEWYVVQCPACYQETFVLRDMPDLPFCLFCGYSSEPEIAANEWIETILGINYGSVIKDGEDYPLYTCPECVGETLVDIGPSGSQFERDQYICFACGQSWKESSMDKCEVCGQLYLVKEDDGGMCPDCFEHQLSKE